MAGKLPYSANPPQSVESFRGLLLRSEPRLRSSLAVTLVAITLIYLVSPNFSLSETDHPDSYQPFAGDFLQEWLGGHMVLNGPRDRFYDLEYLQQIQHDRNVIGIEWHPNAYFPLVYPPFYYALASPLALLPFTTAAVVWNVLMVGCLIVTAIALGRDARHRATICWGLPVCIFFAPMVENLVSSQKATLILLLLTSTYLLLKRGQQTLAGVVFGLIAFKPQLMVVIGLTMLLKRQWKFVLGAVATGLTLFVVSSCVLGFDVWKQYFVLTMRFGDYVKTSGYEHHCAHCWWGACQLLLDGQPSIIIKSAAALGTLLTATLVVFSMKGSVKPDSPRFDIQFSALVIATILISPHLLTYDLAILLLPVVLLVSLLRETWKPGDRDQRMLVALMVGFFCLAGLFDDIALAIGVQCSVVTLIVWLFVLKRLTAPRFDCQTHA